MLGLVIALWIPAVAQQPPGGVDCDFTFTIANSGTGNAYVYNNKQTNCQNLNVFYYASGFSAVSVQIETAPDLNGAPGAFTAIGAGQTITGSNPMTSTTSAVTGFSLTTPPAWIQIDPVTLTGTGTVTGHLVGSRVTLPTIFIPNLISGLTSQPFTTANGAITNLGQVQHRANIILTNAPTKTCNGQADGATNPGFDVFFQGTYDFSNWFEIGSVVQSIVKDNQNLLSAILEADGAYPGIRLNIHAFDNTNCVLTAHYTGNITPNPARTAIIPRYSSNGMQQCSWINTAGAACAQVAVANRFVVIYGWYVSDNSGMVNTVEFTEAGGTVYFQVKLAANASAGPGCTGIAQFTGTRNKTFEAFSTLVTNGYICWRYEDNPQ